MDHKDARIAVLGSLDDPVRHRLYQFVAGRSVPVGRDEAAEAAGIGRPLAAYHLDKLVDLGLLTASYQRPAGRRGPGAGPAAKVYARSEAEFAVSVPPREYQLAARLLAVAVEADGSGTSQAALEGAARRFGAGLGQACAETSAARGPEAVLAVLSEQGFEPFRDEDGTIRLRNCPFRQLAAQHPRVVCGMNLALVNGVIAGMGCGALAPGQASLCPVVEPRPDCCCVAISTARPAAGPVAGPASDDDTGVS